MQKATKGTTVQVHYTGKLGDGSVFDSSRGRDPLEFTVGSGQVIAGFDRAVDGMATGDSKTVTIPADDAYGERREELLITVDRSQFPDTIEPEVGQQLQMTQEGQVAVVTVADVSEAGVTLDANHPLAGKELIFDLELMEVR
jgi:peptidylprolyl isomerase